MSKPRERLRKFLWPSQKSSTLRAVKFEKIKYSFDKSHRQYLQDSQLRQDYLKPSCKLNVITLQMIGQFPTILREFSRGAKQGQNVQTC